jgi:hypothetical protein
VWALSKLFRRPFSLSKLADAFAAKRLQFFGDLDGLSGPGAFAAFPASVRKKNWFVHAKPPFAGPEAVLAYSIDRDKLDQIVASLNGSASRLPCAAHTTPSPEKLTRSLVGFVYLRTSCNHP